MPSAVTLEARRLLTLKRFLEQQERKSRDPLDRWIARDPKTQPSDASLVHAYESQVRAEGAETSDRGVSDLVDRQARADERQRQSRRYRAGLRAAFWLVIGPSPVCDPGETHVARAFWQRIERAIDHGGWSHDDDTILKRMSKKWRRRADGRDARFMVVGTHVGRLPVELETRIRNMQRLRGEG